MGWRCARLISFSVLGECLRIAGASSVYLFSVLDRLWSRMSHLCYSRLFYVAETFTHVSGFWYYICWCIYELMTWIFEAYAIYPLRCLLKISMHDYFGEFIEDVMSISWIFIIFACFIALIDIGCYTSRSLMKREMFRIEEVMV